MKVDDEADFKLGDSVWENILKKFGECPTLEDFPEKERVVVASWAVKGIVGNGGFEYLLYSILPDDQFLTHTVNAFKSLNLAEAVTVIKTLLNYFPNSQLPIDPNERMNIFYSIDDKIRDDLDSRFYAATANFTKDLALFIRENYDIFIKYYQLDWDASN